MTRLFRFALLLLVVAVPTFWILTKPHTVDPRLVEGLSGDPTRGERVFLAGGCGACHMAPGAKDEAQRLLVGGQAFPSPFGTFLAPNISNHPDQGIGLWTVLDLANAMHHGVGRAGEHLYPAFPYTSYIRTTLQDVADLRAYLATLPADATPSQPHRLGFPFNIRLSLGIWKWLYLSDAAILDGPLTPEQDRGRYLVEALGHCGECHTPRGRLGALDTSRWLAGAPDPSGQGTIPNITPGKLKWSEAEIIDYLTTGFTPEYDSVGGHMAHVVENLSRLPEADRAAIAAYLKAVPPID